MINQQYDLAHNSDINAGRPDNFQARALSLSTSFVAIGIFMLLMALLAGCSGQTNESGDGSGSGEPTGNIDHQPGGSSGSETNTGNAGSSEGSTGDSGGSGAGNYGEDNQQGNHTDTNNEELPDAIMDQLSDMTLAQKIGQLVLIGMDGTTVNDQTRALIQQRAVSGIILYKPNIQTSAQTLELLNELKKVNSDGVPLFLSVDQEGGRVNRMPAAFTALPTSRAIGSKNDVRLASAIGGILGSQLLSFGFNMDFAPVLDIDSNPYNPVIGDRSFGAAAELVQRLGIATMQGIRDKGVIPVVKHFPGHGDTSVDSHLELPTVNKTLAELEALELRPFAEAIRQQADAVMIAHILMRQIDSEHPASMSPAIITDLLRGQLGFDGVVITDDMTMGGIVNHNAIGDAAVQSVLAGSDLLLVGHGVAEANEVLDALADSVASGKLTEARIDESVYRLLKLKQKYGLTHAPIETAVDAKAINDRLAAALAASNDSE